MPVARYSREQAAKAFNVHDTPTTFYVDRSGTIRYQVTGVEPHGDAVDRVTWYIEQLKNTGARTASERTRRITMTMTRRDAIKTGLSAAALGAAADFEWVLPALAQGEVMVPFTDSHVNPPFNANPAPDRRLYDTRTVSTIYTPKDEFFTTQHYGHPEVDPVSYRLKVGGLVNSPLTLSLDEIKKMGGAQLIAGFECSGNRRPVQGLIGNGRWTGVPLKAVLDKAGLKANAREIVFFGADRGKEAVNFRGTNFDVEQQYGRSIQRDQALSVDRGAVPRVCAERRSADQAPGRAAAPDHAGLVRRAEREVGIGHLRAGRAVSRQVPGELVSHAPRRNDQRRSEVGREGRQPPAAEVIRRARHQERCGSQDHDDRAERRHADQDRRGEGRRRSVDGRRRWIRRPMRSTGGSCITTPGRARPPASTRWCRASPTPTAWCSRPRKRSSRRRRSSRTTRSIPGR